MTMTDVHPFSPQLDEATQRKNKRHSDPIRLDEVPSSINMENYTLGMLYSDRLNYKLPSFQRKRVWHLERKRGIIDSAFRYYPTLPFLIYREPILDGGKDYLIDGLQRFDALTGFISNKFTTFTQEQLEHWRPNTKLQARVPRLYWDQLGDDWKNLLLKYHIGRVVIEHVDEAVLSEIFFRLQIHSPLTLGETLWTNRNTTTTLIDKIYDHAFWTMVYGDKDVRRERVTEAVTIVGLETSQKGPFISLRKSDLLRLASGVNDGYISEFTLKRVQEKMERAANVFAGAEATARTDIIAIWQATTLLEDAGFDLLRSDQGCLVPSFRQWKRNSIMRNGSMSDHIEAEFNAIAHLPHLRKQRQFWDQKLDLLAHVKGLRRRSETGVYLNPDEQVPDDEDSTEWEA